MKLIIFLGLLVIVASAIGDLDVENIAAQQIKSTFESHISPLVENGQQARQGDLPYHVTVYVLRSNQWIFISGALVAPNWVLTQASSLARLQQLRVYYGSNQLHNAKYVNGQRIAVHPQYETRLGIYNIGLIQLAQEISDGRITYPINLPPAEFKHAQFDNQYILLSGFGSKSGSPLQTLQYSTLKVTSSVFCKSKYPQLAGPQLFCALPVNQERNEYPGYGDIGGPAVLRSRNNYNVLIGLYAFGTPEKISSGEPSGFINICPSIDWIQSVIKTKNN